MCVYCKFFKDLGEQFGPKSRFSCTRTKALTVTPIGFKREVFDPLVQNSNNDCQYFVRRSLIAALISGIKGVFNGQ